MHTNFDGCCHSSFGDIATFINDQISMDYNSPSSSKKLINQNGLKKFMQIGIDEVYMCTNFSGVVSPVSEILLLSKTTKFPFSTMDYSQWSSKNLINQNGHKKFMQVEVSVLSMHTNFVIKKFNCLELAQKNHASRCQCIEHAHQF